MVRPHIDNPRNIRLWIRMTAGEKLAAIEAANKAGLSLSEWARREMLRGPRGARKRAKDAPYAPENMDDLRKVGAKINAIAHALNAGHQVSPDEVARVCSELGVVIKPHLAAMGLRRTTATAKKKGAGRID